MQITTHVHALKLPFTIPLAPGKSLERYVYVYLIIGDRIVLIDSGVAGCEATICSYLERLGRRPSDIAALVLTHAHPDHMGAARPVVEACQCEVLVHALERDWAEDPAKQKRERPVPGFDHLVAGPVAVDRVLTDGDGLDFGNEIRLRVIHTPGHSRGSISLLSERDGVLFSGDAIPQRGELPIYDDVPASVNSLVKLLQVPGVETLLSAWDDPRWHADAEQAMRNGLDYLRVIHRAVCEAAQQGDTQDPMALCNTVMDSLGLPRAAANPLVARSFLAHLKDQATIEEMLGLEP